MAGNSSSSNDSILHSNFPVAILCLFTRPGSLVYTALNITNILLLLPLCILVLYLGLQRWQRQRSTSTAAMTSHSDSFTYHMVAMQLIRVVGCTVCFCAIIWGHVITFYAGYFLRVFTWYGELCFHKLTCVERYLAVVHPVTYLSLRGERGMRIRNISIGCVWLFCVGAASLITEGNLVSVDFCLMTFSVIVIAFCSLSVLRVLIRPGPGEQGGDRERVDESKQRAFYTIVAILGVLLLKCFGSLFVVVFHTLGVNECVILTLVDHWFNLPSSLVLPLLFLHRAGTLACCKNNT
ncbi:uncharacterized protein LOC144459930 [Epinephelus lanceolatus]